MSWREQLPPALIDWLPDLEASVLPCVRLRIQPEPPASASDSYLATVNIEEEGECRTVAVFMQLNFSALPPLPGFPTSGWAQLRIPSQDELYGLSAQQPLLWSFVPAGTELLPLSDDTLSYHAIEGLLDEMPISPDDQRFPQQLEALWHQLGDERWPILAAYRRAIGIGGHRLGGYAGFLQDDPRSDGDHQELFIQLDTDPEHGLLWGDMGRVHWFAAAAERSLDTPASARLTHLRFNLEMS